MVFWNLLDNDKGTRIFGKQSIVGQEYPPEIAEPLFQEAREFILVDYSSSYGPDYSANCYRHETSTKYMRIKEENVVVKDGKFVGAYIYLRNGNRSFEGVLFKDGGHLGNLSESSSYRGSMIPEYSYSHSIFLASYPSNLPFPEQDTPIEKTAAKPVSSANK